MDVFCLRLFYRVPSFELTSDEVDDEFSVANVVASYARVGRTRQNLVVGHLQRHHTVLRLVQRLNNNNPVEKREKEDNTRNRKIFILKLFKYVRKYKCGCPPEQVCHPYSDSPTP